MHRKWIKVDIKKCTGCRLCETACSFKHEINEVNPRLSRIRVAKNELEGIDAPNVCRQCKVAFCAEACPVDAISFNDILCAWVVDESTCIGCGLCVEACPFDSMYMHPAEGIVKKCDLCRGDEPACIEICPTGALTIDEGE